MSGFGDRSRPTVEPERDLHLVHRQLRLLQEQPAQLEGEELLAHRSAILFFLSGWYGDKFSWLTNKGALGSLRNKKSTFFLQNAVRHNLSLHNMFQKVK